MAAERESTASARKLAIALLLAVTCLMVVGGIRRCTEQNGWVDRQPRRDGSDGGPVKPSNMADSFRKQKIAAVSV